MILRFASLALLLWASTPAAGESLSDLPAPLPQSYVSDRANLLAADTRSELDRLAYALDTSDKGQLAVAVVRTTGGVDQRRFATDLFNRWGVGDRSRDDGVLLFLARDDRAAEIILGDGIDDDSNVAHVEAVMQEDMVPRFRDGNPDQAMIAGASAVLRRIYTLDLSRPAELPAQGLPATFAGFDAAAAAAPPAADAPAPIAAPVGQPAPAQRAESAGGTAFGADVAIGLAILAALASGAAWLGRKLLRLLWWVTGSAFPRRCTRCSARMQRLDEVADDAHLSPAQRVEEKLGSVDHRVFLCPACGQVDKLVRRAWFTRYGDCKACQSRALSSVSKTLESATRYSTGLAEITSTCQHCGDTRVERRTLPRVTPSSSSSGGRSFGGGSSSGRGASGRW